VAAPAKLNHGQDLLMTALFTTTAYPLIALIEDIARGKIGLPEIQRPFVWPNVNVRNLFDSLYRGFPLAIYCSGRLVLIQECALSASITIRRHLH
jgi:uncharacterized protein with ParB-like and HNH nuclease domain